MSQTWTSSQAPGDGVAVDGGDDRLAEVPDLHKGVDVAFQVGAPLVGLHILGVGVAGFPADVKAGGEGAAGAGEDYYPQVRVVFTASRASRNSASRAAFMALRRSGRLRVR